MRFLIGLLVMLSSVASLRAQELADAFEGMYNPKRLLRGAQLTDAQVAQIRELRRPTRAKEAAIEREIEHLNAEFQMRLTADGPLDADKFVALVDRLEQLNREMEMMKVHNLIKIRALLTPEQLKHVADAQQKLRSVEKLLGSVEQQRRSLEEQKRAIEPTIAAESRL